MRHAKAWRAIGPAVLTAALAACAAAEDSLSINAPKDSSTAGGASDAGASGASSGTPGSLLHDNAIILVHAAGFPAYRLCFSNYPDAEPTPNAALMPEANVVGVDVGSAVRIDPLADGGVPGDVYAYDEELIRSASSCTELLKGNNFKLATKLGTLSESLSNDVHLLAVTGCESNGASGTYTAAQCGQDYDGDAGNLAIKDLALPGLSRTDLSQLPTQVVNLSPALEQIRGANHVQVSYGALATNGVGGAVTADPPLADISTPLSPTPTLDPSDETVYGKFGFTVTVDTLGTVAQQSLADIQLLSSARDVPTTYYATASNYVLLLLGQPDIQADGGNAGVENDIRKRLHFLAVPVINPKPDAGADAGTTADGGTKPDDDGGVPTAGGH